MRKIPRGAWRYNSSITKILTRECAMVINLPILKDHSMAGVTFSMKNMYGVVDQTQFDAAREQLDATPAWPT
jgi:uncharacterized protein (DUF362 family)